MRAKVAEPPPPVREEDLRHWNLLRRFRQCLEKVFGTCCLGRSWEDSKRVLGALDYLSLFLFGLLNPVARTLRGLSEASILERVQQEVCSQRVPRATFSDAQHVLEPALLEKVFDDLSAQVPKVTNPQLGAWEWLARDGSLFRALPRMTWALYGAGSPGGTQPRRASAPFLARLRG